MIPRRVSCNPSRRQRLRKREDRVRRTAQLERPAALQVLALEDQASPELGIEQFIAQERRAVHVGPDASRRRADGGEIRYVFVGRQFGAHALLQSMRDAAANPGANRRSR